jgi:hypothetical protein
MSKVHIKLHDELDYLIHVSEVEHPLKKVYFWGSRAFEKVGKRRYREVTFGIILDTDDRSFRTSRDG